jgi:transglutaminase-like putative cysteine protease
MPERIAGPFVPAGDARIAAQARRIIGNAPSSAAAAAALVEWVHSTITLDAAGPSGALAALTTRRGNAAAQAALLVALARSANLPARLVGGVVTTPDGRWHRHTWAELYTDRWLPADPSFGRYPTDAAYVRLTTDRPGHVLAVDPAAARLTPLSDVP